MQNPNLNLSFRSLSRMVAGFVKARKQLRPARLVLACIALVGFSFVFAGRANAMPCWALTSPSATLSLGLGVPSVESTSNGGIYEKSGCHYWVVDISVPSNSSGGQNSIPSFGIYLDTWGPHTKAGCQTYEDYFVVFVKHQGQDQFESTPIAHGSRTGVWNPGKDAIPLCGLKESKTYVNLSDSLNPPASGTDVYRVAAAVRSGSKWKTVNVLAQHVVIPR